MDVEVQPIIPGRDTLADKGLQVLDRTFPAENEMAFGDQIATNPQCYK
jgi:hypothetical protein